MDMPFGYTEPLLTSYPIQDTEFSPDKQLSPFKLCHHKVPGAAQTTNRYIDQTHEVLYGTSSEDSTSRPYLNRRITKSGYGSDYGHTDYSSDSKKSSSDTKSSRIPKLYSYLDSAKGYGSAASSRRQSDASDFEKSDSYSDYGKSKYGKDDKSKSSSSFSKPSQSLKSKLYSGPSSYGATRLPAMYYSSDYYQNSRKDNYEKTPRSYSERIPVYKRMENIKAQCKGSGYDFKKENKSASDKSGIESDTPFINSLDRSGSSEKIAKENYELEHSGTLKFVEDEKPGCNTSDKLGDSAIKCAESTASTDDSDDGSSGTICSDSDESATNDSSDGESGSDKIEAIKSDSTSGGDTESDSSEELAHDDDDDEKESEACVLLNQVKSDGNQNQYEISCNAETSLTQTIPANTVPLTKHNENPHEISENSEHCSLENLCQFGEEKCTEGGNGSKAKFESIKRANSVKGGLLRRRSKGKREFALRRTKSQGGLSDEISTDTLSKTGSNGDISQNDNSHAPKMYLKDPKDLCVDRQAFASNRTRHKTLNLEDESSSSSTSSTSPSFKSKSLERKNRASLKRRSNRDSRPVSVNWASTDECLPPKSPSKVCSTNETVPFPQDTKVLIHSDNDKRDIPKTSKESSRHSDNKTIPARSSSYDDVKTALLDQSDQSDTTHSSNFPYQSQDETLYKSIGNLHNASLIALRKNPPFNSASIKSQKKAHENFTQSPSPSIARIHRKLLKPSSAEDVQEISDDTSEASENLSEKEIVKEDLSPNQPSGNQRKITLRNIRSPTQIFITPSTPPVLGCPKVLFPLGLLASKKTPISLDSDISDDSESSSDEDAEEDVLKLSPPVNIGGKSRSLDSVSKHFPIIGSKKYSVSSSEVMNDSKSLDNLQNNSTEDISGSLKILKSDDIPSTDDDTELSFNEQKIFSSSDNILDEESIENGPCEYEVTVSVKQRVFPANDVICEDQQEFRSESAPIGLSGDYGYKPERSSSEESKTATESTYVKDKEDCKKTESESESEEESSEELIEREDTFAKVHANVPSTSTEESSEDEVFEESFQHDRSHSVPVGSYTNAKNRQEHKLEPVQESDNFRSVSAPLFKTSNEPATKLNVGLLDSESSSSYETTDSEDEFFYHSAGTVPIIMPLSSTPQLQSNTTDSKLLQKEPSKLLAIPIPELKIQVDTKSSSSEISESDSEQMESKNCDLAAKDDEFASTLTHDSLKPKVLDVEEDSSEESETSSEESESDEDVEKSQASSVAQNQDLAKLDADAIKRINVPSIKQKSPSIKRVSAIWDEGISPETIESVKNLEKVPSNKHKFTEANLPMKAISHETKPLWATTSAPTEVIKSPPVKNIPTTKGQTANSSNQARRSSYDSSKPLWAKSPSSEKIAPENKIARPTNIPFLRKHNNSQSSLNSIPVTEISSKNALIKKEENTSNLSAEFFAPVPLNSKLPSKKMSPTISKLPIPQRAVTRDPELEGIGVYEPFIEETSKIRRINSKNNLSLNVPKPIVGPETVSRNKQGNELVRESNLKSPSVIFKNKLASEKPSNVSPVTPPPLGDVFKRRRPSAGSKKQKLVKTKRMKYQFHQMLQGNGAGQKSTKPKEKNLNKESMKDEIETTKILSPPVIVPKNTIKEKIKLLKKQSSLENDDHAPIPVRKTSSKGSVKSADFSPSTEERDTMPSPNTQEPKQKPNNEKRRIKRLISEVEDIDSLLDDGFAAESFEDFENKFDPLDKPWFKSSKPKKRTYSMSDFAAGMTKDCNINAKSFGPYISQYSDIDELFESLALESCKSSNPKHRMVDEYGEFEGLTVEEIQADMVKIHESLAQRTTDQLSRD
ncbi:hypothetical protein GQR58_014884 [Nymphon striatum]|nr:hypothetical protein GQR58_014884 [Nymphon striatum]